MSFSNKVVVITGGASGIGLAAAELLASQGARVSLCDLQQTALDGAVAKIKQNGGQAMGTALDIRVRKDVEAWVETTVRQMGKIDGAVNAAGIGGKGMLVQAIHEIDDQDWDLVFDVNVKGVLNSIRAQIPNMNDGGAIVNIASLAGLSTAAKITAYAASKSAVIALSRAAAKELGPRNIRVNTVCPGPIETPLLRSTAGPDPATPANYAAASALGRIGRPSEVAALIAWLLSDGSSYISGTTQVIDGGILYQ